LYLSLRKPILIVDDSEDSQTAKEMFRRNNVEYVQYHVDKLESSCCGGASDENESSKIVSAPTIFAPEGVFRGIDQVKNYFNVEGKFYESESAYW
jgi:hypothetical protein